MRIYDVENVRNIKRLVSLLNDEIYIETSVIYDGTTDYRIYKIDNNQLILLFELGNFERIQEELKDYLTPLEIDKDKDEKAFISKRNKKIYYESESSSLFKMCNHRFISVEPAFTNLDWSKLYELYNNKNRSQLEEEVI